MSSIIFAPFIFLPPKLRFIINKYSSDTILFNPMRDIKFDSIS